MSGDANYLRLDLGKLKKGLWREWVTDNAADIAVVASGTRRDATGIHYEVRVTLRSLASTSFEEGEDEITVWTRRVDFGQTDAAAAGGYLFVEAARDQERISNEISAIMDRVEARS